MKRTITRYLKRSIFLRGVYELWKTYFSIRRRQFGYVGEDVLIIPPLWLSGRQNIYLYDNTKITNAEILATNAKFTMMRNSAAAEGLKVICGGHERVLGQFYRKVVKTPEMMARLDRDVTVEEDVWIGVNVTLLSGIVVRRGATLAAGSVVTKSLPPYCIAGGVPAKFIKFKWTIDEILYHEEILYSPQERISKEELVRYFEEYSRK